MIGKTLHQRNLELLQDTNRLMGILNKSRISGELVEYKARVHDVCELCQEIIERNISALVIGKNDILEEILSNTQQATQIIRLLSERFLPPISRFKEEDRLSLYLLNWLHKTHPKTDQTPSAISDGGVAVFPLTPEIPIFPTIYYFPYLERQSLLYQSLLFHEFGHLLYGFHKPEMDAIVAELQREIADLLMPVSQRNDRHSAYQANSRQMIVNTWYSWIQELFCDLVGFTIGGPAFLLAFSKFLCTMQRSEFYRTPKSLAKSDHPVAWLRVKFLAQTAYSAGYHNLSNEILDEWSAYAAAMNIKEDFHGFYAPSLEGCITNALSDLLTETSPQPFGYCDISSIYWKPGEPPVHLLNLAWNIYRMDTSKYIKWETAQIKLLLSRHL